MRILEAIDLGWVRGGLDEGQLRSLAAEKCPRTYARLARTPMSRLTRADANACVKEWNPDPFTRSYVNSQLDSYFGQRR